MNKKNNNKKSSNEDDFLNQIYNEMSKDPKKQQPVPQPKDCDEIEY